MNPGFGTSLHEHKETHTSPHFQMDRADLQGETQESLHTSQRSSARARSAQTLKEKRNNMFIFNIAVMHFSAR